MKIVVLLLIISTTCLAQVQSKVNITISIDGKKENLKCSLGSNNYTSEQTKIDVYSCKKGKEKFLIKYTPDYQYWEGVKVNKDHELESVSVIKVKKHGDLLFKSEDFSLNNIKKKNLRATYEELDSIKYSLSDLNADNSKLSKDVLFLKSEINNKVQNESNRIENLLSQHEDVDVETTDGRKINCRRGEDKSGNTCLFYKCNNISESGESFEVSLRNIGLNQGGTRPYLISANDSSLGPDLEIKSLSMGGDNYYVMNEPIEPLPGSGYIPDFLKKSTINYLTLNNPIDSMYRKNEIQNCEKNSEVVELEKTIYSALNKSQIKADQIKMVEVVKLVSEGLERYVIPESEITNRMCRIEGDVYAESRENSQKIGRQIAGMSSVARPISMDELNELAKFALEQKDIPYEYYLDGCFARAHTLTARIEDKYNIETEKIWAIGATSAPNDRKNIWNYHVAPKLNVEDENGNIVSYVLDPSISKEPLKEEQWLKKIIVNPKANRMKVAWPPVANTGAVKNIKITYSPNEVYRMDQKIEDITEQVMRANDEGARASNEMYMRYLNEK